MSPIPPTMASPQELPGALASRRPEELSPVALHHKNISNSLRTKSPANKHTNNPSSDGGAPKSDRLNTDRFSIHFTVNFIMLSFLLAAIISFLGGKAVQIILLSKGDSHFILTTSSTTNTIHGGMSIHEHTRLNSGEDAGQTMSTSEVKHSPSKRGDEDEDVDAGINHYKEDPHLPSGEHLLVDIRGVNSRFLKSDERIATIVTAMVDLTKECKIALLSYHCHSHASMGVSCFGVLTEGHVSIRSWPKEGVIFIDLFRFGASSNMVQALPIIKKLFMVPCHDLVEGTDEDLPEPKLIWSYKLRGFREGFYGYEPHDNPLESDVGLDLLRMHYLDTKEVLISEETEFQHVDIYELSNPRVTSLASYGRSSLHSEMNRPDKILYLDGVQQSSLYGETAYHEALVHPSMITHPNPRRVAIIGGGEGATLREVLKHNTVEEVVMVEIDGELVEMCREHLPEWSDCTDLVGSEDSCFDDSRASVIFEDAFAWFIDNFGNGENNREKLDLIIMDALDPDKFVEIVGALYNNDRFVRSLYDGLADDGVVVVQIGESQGSEDPALEVGKWKDTAHMIETFQSVGFESMHTYDEGHSGYFAPWSYLVCFKDSKSRASWYETSAANEIKMHQRLPRTKSGKPSLLYFDAPAMTSYQLPPKAHETVYCRKVVTPRECEDGYNGTNPKLVNPISLFEAHKMKGISKQACHGLPGTVYSPVFERHLKELWRRLPLPA